MITPRFDARLLENYDTRAPMGVSTFAIPPVFTCLFPSVLRASKDSPSCNPTMFTTRIISPALLLAYPYPVWLEGKNGLLGLSGFVCTCAADR